MELDLIYPSKPLTPFRSLTLYTLLITQLLLCFLSLPYFSHLLPLLPFGSVTLCLMYLSSLASALTLYASQAGGVEKRKWAHTMV